MIQVGISHFYLYNITGSFKYLCLVFFLENQCCDTISDLSKRKRSWDVFVVFLAIFNSFAVPMEFVFKDLTNNTSYNALDTIITFIFIADIIVAFNTRYIDGTGETITDRKKIARRYMKGDFIIDFISSIPFKILGLLFDFFNQISILKILKVVRIRRITKLVLKLEFREEQKAVSSPQSLTNSLCVCLGHLHIQVGFGADFDSAHSWMLLVPRH